MNSPLADLLASNLQSYLGSELKSSPIIDIIAAPSSSAPYWHVETSTAYFELPGVSKSDIVLNIDDDGKIVVEAERKEPYKNKFSYRLNVNPCVVNLDSSVATFDNGILKLKFEPNKRASKRNINIL